MTAINPQAVRGPVTAVPVVAGTGVRFVEDVPNNRVVAEVDETVLWESNNADGTSPSNFPITLSEVTSNFERVRFYFRPWSTNDCVVEKMGNQAVFMLESTWVATNQGKGFAFTDVLTPTGTSLAYTTGVFAQWDANTVSTDTSQFRLYKIVGINRIASA